MKFYKYQNFGNDFIFFDDRLEGFSFNKRFIQKICDRNMGIGADGVILLQNSKIADFKMEIFNRDGSIASSCGNGLGCFVKFLKDLNEYQKEVFIESRSGVVRGACKGEKVSIVFEEPKILKEVFIDGMKLKCIDSGVLHAVLFCDDLDIDVEKIGSKIRYHDLFVPDGLNVNFVKIDNNEVFVRTYEKGVEAETLSCGTGALAVAKAIGKKRIALKFKAGMFEIKDFKELIMEPLSVFTGEYHR